MNRKRQWKAAGRAMRLLALLCVLMAALGRMPVGMAQAAQAREGVYVYDEAELLSVPERNSLAERLEKRGREAGCGIYVLTSDGSGNGTSDKYLEDFYDAGFASGQINPDAVLIHIDMEERYVNVQAYGKAEEKIPDATGEKIIDAIFDDLHYGNYYDACMTYADKAAYYMNYVPIFLRAWVQLLIALVIGAVAVGIMVSNSGGKVTVGANTYLDQRYSGVKASRDDYIRTSVTKRKKPEPSSSGGGGGGHTSSGGHSHSSAGRHF